MESYKIIFLSPSTQGESLKYCNSDYKIIFVHTWAGLLARRLKKYNPEFDISCWSIEPFLKRKIEKKVFDIFGIIWPFKFILIKNVLSFPMYLQLLRLSFRYKVILHYHNLFDSFILIRFLLPPKVKIVLSQHGGVPPKKGSFKHYIFKFSYKFISAFTYVNLKTKEYLKNLKIPDSKLHFLPVGVDFDLMKPISKEEARNKLGLSKYTVYGIYVGKFYSLKSVDIILYIFEKLKSKYDFKIIFVGGEDNEINDLYEEVKKSGCPYFGFQEYSNMKYFYSASDFYIHPVFNPKFGGLDVSWMEALACNKPVLSTKLSYLDFDYSELGICLNDQSEVLEKTEWMINNYHKFTKCREIAQKYLDGNKAIMERLIRIYEGLT